MCDVGSLNGIKIVERSQYPTTDASNCQSGADSGTSKPCSRLISCYLLINLAWLSSSRNWSVESGLFSGTPSGPLAPSAFNNHSVCSNR